MKNVTVSKSSIIKLNEKRTRAKVIRGTLFGDRKSSQLDFVRSEGRKTSGEVSVFLQYLFISARYIMREISTPIKVNSITRTVAAS